MSYHIRGGLKGINTDANNNLTSNLFSFRLEYENDGIYYDGNIRKQEWKSNIDNVTRSYTNAYDGSSRLKASAYASTKAGENYALNNVNYDANGNITALSRSGATNANFTIFGNVDNLNYTYPSNSNKLSKIQDLTTTNTDLGDFRDGTNTDDDYEYWLDGSLKKDKNKKIASITYNYLKLPEVITFDDAKTITTEYDADGTKLKKIVSGGETTDYEEDDIYVNGVLYQTSHDEGRIVNGVYEYNINDHLGNLRVAFKDSAGIAVPTQSIFYDPWGLSMKGMSITRNPLNFNKHQFLNQEIQFETGYIDLQNRQYDPQRGQMTSIDALAELSRRFSPFVYGNNNPLRFIDPDGMESTEIIGADGLTNSQWVAANGSADKEDEFKNINKEKKNEKKNENGKNATSNFELSDKDKKTYPKFSQLIQGLRSYVKKNKNVMDALLDYSGLSKEEILKYLEYDNGPQINVVEMNGRYGYFDGSEDVNAINVDKSWVLGYEKAQLNSTKQATGFVLAATLLHEFVHLSRNSKHLSEGIYDYGFGFEKGAFGGNIIDKENAIKLYKQYFKK